MPTINTINIKILKKVLNNRKNINRYDLFEVFGLLIKLIIKKYHPLEVLIFLR